MTPFDPSRLVAALEAAGFTRTGCRTGMYVRLAWPRDPRTLIVPTDVTAPEHTDLMAAVLSELEWAAERGRAAQHALDAIR